MTKTISMILMTLQVVELVLGRVLAQVLMDLVYQLAITILTRTRVSDLSRNKQLLSMKMRTMV